MRAPLGRLGFDFKGLNCYNLGIVLKHFSDLGGSVRGNLSVIGGSCLLRAEGTEAWICLYSELRIVSHCSQSKILVEYG